MTTRGPEFVQGARLVAAAEFRRDGVPIDPTVVRCYVRDPDGSLLELVYPSVDLVRVAVGTYEAYITAVHAGTYGIRFTGAGTVEAVREERVSVAASSVI